MPPILINVIQGFSARVRPEWSTVSHLVKHVLEPFKDEVRINVENPGDRHCIRRSLKFLYFIQVLQGVVSHAAERLM